MVEPANLVVLDVRTMLPRDRHPKIFEIFDGLPLNGVLRLVNDHDPMPLYYQFQAERPGEVSWEPQQQGPDTWIIHIRKAQA